MNKKGFTLIEIIMVMTLIAILSVIALTSTINSQAQFNYLSFYKQSLQILKSTRTYALTDYAVNTGGPQAEVPQSIGATIESDKITIFADLEDAPDRTLNQYTFDSQYSISNSSDSLTISYLPTSADFSAKDSADADITDKYIILTLNDSKNPDFQRYIVIYTLSGIVEGHANLDELAQIGIIPSSP